MNEKGDGFIISGVFLACNFIKLLPHCEAVTRGEAVKAVTRGVL